MRSMRLVGVVLLVALHGCGSGDPIGCAEDLSPASVVPKVVEKFSPPPLVALTVVDNANSPLAGVIVSYQVNGGPTFSEACEFTGVCALSQGPAGTFSIVASKAGYSSASASVTVGYGECGVITERLTLVLTPQG